MDEAARPTLFCLHFLGGSARTWDALRDALRPDMDVVGLDLPGFGGAAGTAGYDVAEMAAHVVAAITARAPGRWLLAGHSMGAKVAAVVARQVEDGAEDDDPALRGLAGLVLLAGSPPGPEPMDDARRQDMLGWFTGDPAACRTQAEAYIRANVGAPLDTPEREALVDAMLAARLDAWRAWLEAGSREDWSDRIGVLRTKALVLSGSADADLGRDAQERLVLPHLMDAEAVELPGAGHLLPVERPAVVAALIASRFATPLQIPPAYRALIDSHRVSTGTRQALLDRAVPPEAATTLSPAERGTLRAIIDRVIPQSGPHRIDLAGPLAAGLAGPGDGWRNAVLPPDAAAGSAGLRTMEAIAHGFAGRPAAEQDAVLDRTAAGRGGGHAAGLLDAPQMRAWFEDLRAEATRQYVAHPATFARMGYSGIACAGDGADKQGFTAIGIGQREAWEPT